MRVCIETSTNRLIEAQSGGDDPAYQTVPDGKTVCVGLQPLLDNSVSAGLTPAQVTLKYVTDAEYATLILTAPTPPEPTLADALASPGIQALLGLLSQQQGATTQVLEREIETNTSREYSSEYMGVIQRRAKALQENGQEIDALLLLKTIGG